MHPLSWAIALGNLLAARALTTSYAVDDDNDPARVRAITAITTLQSWYNNHTGLWDTTGWWNAANILTTIADLAVFDKRLNSTVADIFRCTYHQAQISSPIVIKVRTPSIVDTISVWTPGLDVQTPFSVRANGFLNNYYDDEGWWALAWLRVFDVTQNVTYLRTAMGLFEDMVLGYNATCGGLWWSKHGRRYNGAIENELFLALAAQLALKAPNSNYYRRWALKQEEWFFSSGLINRDWTINDGLDLQTCRNNRGTVWTYNQGVVLGALVDLDALFPERHYLAIAHRLVTAAVEALTDKDGILHEPCEPDCGNDGPQFKGIFVRNVQKLQQKARDPFIARFIERNAEAIWTHDRDVVGRFGLVWSGAASNVSTASTHGSACDALVAAAAINALLPRVTEVPISVGSTPSFARNMFGE